MRAGMQIGQFVFDRKLGEGGMAEVWLGHNAVLGSRVAIKFLLTSYAVHPELVERFLGEARRQSAIDHPNIVKVYGFEYVEGRSFMIMQYVEGETLEDRLSRSDRKPLETEDILRIASGTLNGLEHAHSLQMVHRDIKPSNIMLDRNLHPYLCDFGLVLVRNEQRLTRTGTLMGTPLYMSPEQIMRPKDVDHRSDIYSFGCVLYKMFAGRTPFEAQVGDSDMSIAVAHTSQAPPPLRQFNPSVSPAVEAVIMKCLEKNRDQRFSSCGDLREELAHAVLGQQGRPNVGKHGRPTVVEVVKPNPLPGRAPIVPPTAARGRRKTGRNIAIASAILAAALAWPVGQMIGNWMHGKPEDDKKTDSNNTKTTKPNDKKANPTNTQPPAGGNKTTPQTPPVIGTTGPGQPGQGGAKPAGTPPAVEIHTPDTNKRPGWVDELKKKIPGGLDVKFSKAEIAPFMPQTGIRISFLTGFEKELDVIENVIRDIKELKEVKVQRESRVDLPPGVDILIVAAADVYQRGAKPR